LVTTMARDRKQHIKSALTERDSRIACHIVEMARSLFDLFDELSPPVLEALLDAHAERERSSQPGPKHRKEIRAALAKYAEQALNEAKKRERRLFQGITGIEDKPELE
jgi:hypothetical protein